MRYKKKRRRQTVKLTKRITQIDNKITERKKAHTYLEKYKFILSYKIQLSKKELGVQWKKY